MRRLAGLTVVSVLVAVAWAWWSASGQNRPPDGGHATSTGGRDADVPARPDEAFAMTVTHVHDGDTLTARIPRTNDVVTTTDPIRIRIVGIDTPEIGEHEECWGGEATRAARGLMPDGARIWVAPDRDTWDDYRRRLFNVWTDDGRFVPFELVEAGHAEAIRIWPNVAYADLLERAQEAAQERGVGRWTC